MFALASTAAVAQDFRIGLQEDPDILDPVRARTYVSRVVFTPLCDKLVDIDNQLHIVPQLATSWSWSADNTVLTFKLRNDVVFHDNTKFDAIAAKANLERALTLPDSFRKSELSSVEKVDAPDPQTLVLTLKQPDATLLSQLSDRAGMMVSPASFNSTDKYAVGRHPVCSGPYKFVERVQNDRIVLEKFDNYYDAKDYHFKKVIFLPIPDTTVRLQNLRAGDLDMLERLSPSDVPDVKKDPKLRLASVPGLGFEIIQFNQNNGERAKTNPFRDARVRAALNVAVDREAINQAIGSGLFQPAGQLFPPASPYADAAKFPVPARDVAKAKALLKEAGMPHVKAEFIFGNDTTSAAVAQMIQVMASEVGIDLELRPTEYAALNGFMQSGNFQVAMRAWSGRPDPDGNIYQYVACKGGWNDGRYCNPEVDKLLLQARTVTEQAQRKALYDQAQAMADKDAANMYLYFPPWPFVLQKKVQGFVPYTDGMIRLKGVSFASKG
jgi:peptide/nickel transport system substrate-binding protein